MKLQLKSLAVQECGPLRDVEISFLAPDGRPRPVTVIGGANGSGKTTILELIFALMQIMHPERKADVLKSPILTRIKETRLQLALEDQSGYVSLNWDPIKGVSHSYSRSPLFKALRQTIFLRNPTISLPFEHYKTLPRADLEQPDETNTLAPSILYFPYYRRIMPGRGTELSRENTTYQWTFRYETVQAFKGSLNAYLVWFEYAEADTFALIRQYLNETVLVDKAVAYVDRPNLQTMVELPNGVTHPLDELSSGEQNLLIIMLELWRRLLPGSIVLIDEIENSLHPAFQHRLAEALLKLQARIPFQLIVTTHAPAFLDAFGADNALILTEF